MWARVAEDYAPFDVDVTTQAPAQAAITRSGSSDQQYGTRVLIDPTTWYQSGCGCGGVAYVGVYDNTSHHAYYQPALVFTKGVGTGAKNIAEAASHEAGHNIGLSHDGTASVGYYQGHGAWAPIMGVGYSKAISQWSKGEYSGANNKEDDFAVAGQNGLALRADDHGNGTGDATALTLGTTRQRCLRRTTPTSTPSGSTGGRHLHLRGQRGRVRRRPGHQAAVAQLRRHRRRHCRPGLRPVELGYPDRTEREHQPPGHGRAVLPPGREHRLRQPAEHRLLHLRQPRRLHGPRQLTHLNCPGPSFPPRSTAPGLCGGTAQTWRTHEQVPPHRCACLRRCVRLRRAGRCGRHASRRQQTPIEELLAQPTPGATALAKVQSRLAEVAAGNGLSGRSSAHPGHRQDRWLDGDSRLFYREPALTPAQKARRRHRAGPPRPSPTPRVRPSSCTASPARTA